MFFPLVVHCWRCQIWVSISSYVSLAIFVSRTRGCVYPRTSIICLHSSKSVHLYFSTTDMVLLLTILNGAAASKCCWRHYMCSSTIQWMVAEGTWKSKSWSITVGTGTAWEAPSTHLEGLFSDPRVWWSSRHIPSILFGQHQPIIKGVRFLPSIHPKLLIWYPCFGHKILLG